MPPAAHELSPWSPNPKQVHEESGSTNPVYSYADTPDHGQSIETERYVSAPGALGPPIKRSGSAIVSKLYPELQEKVESCLLDPDSVTLGPQVGKGKFYFFYKSFIK